MLILEKSHKKFKRDCNNLYIEKEILLSEALCKTQFIIEHMDGRKIFIEHDDIVEPNMKKVITGEGMTDKNGNVIQGDVFTEDTFNSYINANHHMVATIGVKDLVIVDTQSELRFWALLPEVII